MFEDGFDDGQPFAIGGERVWTQHGGGADAVAESEGRLVLTAAGEGYANTHLITRPLEGLAFLKRPLTVRVEGLQIDSQSRKSTFRLSFTPDAKPAFIASTGVMLRLNAVGYLTLGYKINRPKIDPTSVHLIAAVQLDQAPDALELTLDADGFVVRAEMPDGAIESLSGRFVDEGPGLAPADWGGEAAALVLQSQKVPEETSDAVAVSLDRVVVEPAAPESE